MFHRSHSHTAKIHFSVFMPPSTIGGRGIMFCSRSSVCQLHCPPVIQLFCMERYYYTYLVEGFQSKLAKIFIVWMGIAEKVYKVRGRSSRSWPGRPAQLTYIVAEAFVTAVWRQRLACFCRVVYTRLQGTNVGNFTVVACFHPRLKLTRCSAIAERPRCRVRYSFRRK